jgi:glycolate oxidase FAD binding subunit
MSATCSIDGLSLPLVRPQSVSDAAALVREAASTRKAIYPVAGQTMLDYGLPPIKEGMAVDLRSVANVIDYPVRDMTVTVEAGITIGALQGLLASENQRLPVDVPLDERATLGGALATNASGPRRFGFGTLRDYVIGISAINDRGEQIKAGGRVVKNVAGYDLCKLFIGSLGTLGIITQVTLKLRPRPESRALTVVECPDDKLSILLDLADRTRTRPVCLELFNRAAVRRISSDSFPGVSLRESEWTLVIGFEDNAAAVRWQAEQMASELAGEGFRVVDQHSKYLGQALLDLFAKESILRFKANLLPSATADFCRQADNWPDRLMLQAQAGNGIVYGHAGAGLTLDRAASMLQFLQSAAGKAQGNIVLLRCPTPWKKTLPVWGAPRGDYHLMRSIKRKLDPNGLFNPGRFIDVLVG